MLGRSRSTISREINKWIQNPNDKYNAELAHWNAKDNYLNKRKLDKISTYKKLRKSMTYDNGIEMAKHQIITQKT